MTSSSRGTKSWISSLVTGTIAVAALAGVVWMQRSQLDRPSQWVENPKQAERQEALRLALLKQSPSFGFDNVLADWTFLNFLQYFGDDPAREKTGFSLSPQYFDIITQLDPRFVEAYLFLSGSISYQLGQPELAISLMQRGTKTLSPHINPKAFQVWRFMSLDQLLLLGDIPGAIHSLQMAAKWVEGTPYAEYALLFEQTADFLKKDPNSKPVRIASWATIYQQAAAIGDKQTQERAKQQIEALGGKISVVDGKLVIESPPAAPAKTRTGKQR
ncbi:tetratricopeptide repeat protein [Leptodesmis sp.]|uniref:tetratricopeptide repeat protein n=1 Tax=Leptodesmis sp. TaxID=3100501 RepID=UPI0040535B2A